MQVCKGYLFVSEEEHEADVFFIQQIMSLQQLCLLLLHRVSLLMLLLLLELICLIDVLLEQSLSICSLLHSFDFSTFFQSSYRLTVVRGLAANIAQVHRLVGPVELELQLIGGVYFSRDEEYTLYEVAEDDQTEDVEAPLVIGV